MFIACYIELFTCAEWDIEDQVYFIMRLSEEEKKFLTYCSKEENVSAELFEKLLCNVNSILNRVLTNGDKESGVMIIHYFLINILCRAMYKFSNIQLESNFYCIKKKKSF